MKEEEELQLAIALSQSEAESKVCNFQNESFFLQTRIHDDVISTVTLFRIIFQNRSQSYKPVTRSKSFSPPVVQHVRIFFNVTRIN